MARVFRTSLVIAALSICAASVPRTARAEEDAAAAEALFQEARKLSDAGNYKEACPKFLASQKAGPGVGTLLNLGACYEKLGQIASAWARYKEAQSFAQRTNRPDREKTARERAQKLEPRLPKLTISWKDPALEVKRDDVPVDEGAIGAPIPVDPGSHTITARAPGKKTFSKTVSVTEAQNENVLIPALEEDTSGASNSNSNTTSNNGKPEGTTDTTTDNATPLVESKSNPLRTVSYVAMGVGAVGIGVGSYFGITTFSTWSDAKKHCQATACDSTGVKLAGDAKNDGVISTVFIIGGVAVLGTGVVLFFLSPDKTAAPTTGTLTSPKVAPVVSPTFAGLSLSGAL